MGSAILLSRALLQQRPGEVAVDGVARRYGAAWRRNFGWRARFGRWLGWCERTRGVSEMLLRVLSTHPAVVSRIVQHSRPSMRLSGGERLA
jgi:hypothetical protein